MHSLVVENLAKAYGSVQALRGVSFAVDPGEVFGREAGRVAAIGFVLALISYVLQVIAQLWTKAALLHRYSVFRYYSPMDIVTMHQVPAKSAAVLLGLIIVAIGLSAWRFWRRDIP